jgi:hypothetical protein
VPPSAALSDLRQDECFNASQELKSIESHSHTAHMEDECWHLRPLSTNSNAWQVLLREIRLDDKTWAVLWSISLSFGCKGKKVKSSLCSI